MGSAELKFWPGIANPGYNAGLGASLRPASVIPVLNYRVL
jgi:hypothetical protein